MNGIAEPRVSVFALITVALWVGFTIYIMATARSTKADRFGQTSWARIPKGACIGGLFYVLYSPQIFTGWPASRIVPAGIASGMLGIVLAAAGVSLAIAARRSLGPNWSDLVVIKQDHALIGDGPYRWVRHPLYVGFLVAMLGSAIAVGTAAAFLATAICALVLVLKARREETLLQRQFPVAYPEYMRRVKGWVPSLW